MSGLRRLALGLGALLRLALHMEQPRQVAFPMLTGSLGGQTIEEEVRTGTSGRQSGSNALQQPRFLCEVCAPILRSNCVCSMPGRCQELGSRQPAMKTLRSSWCHTRERLSGGRPTGSLPSALQRVTQDGRGRC